MFSLPDSSILEENPPQVWFKKKAGVDDQPKFRWPTRSHPLASKNGFHRPPEDGAPFPRTPWSEDQSSWRCNSWCPPSRRFRVASKLTVRYWKWPFLVELPIENGDFPSRTVMYTPPHLWSLLVCENVGKMTHGWSFWYPRVEQWWINLSTFFFVEKHTRLVYSFQQISMQHSELTKIRGKRRKDMKNHADTPRKWSTNSSCSTQWVEG